MIYLLVVLVFLLGINIGHCIGRISMYEEIESNRIKRGHL